jgi:hypothetical protein
MKKTISYIFVLLALSCVATKQNGKELLQSNKDIEIAKVLTINNKDTLYFNELRLHLSSALYTKKYMFTKFGHWDDAIKINNYENYLIWKNCKLFEGNEDLYTVAASGVENRREMYSSIIVQNKNNIDVLAENSELRDTLVSMFYYGTKKVTFNNDKFKKEYLKMRDSIK